MRIKKSSDFNMLFCIEIIFIFIFSIQINKKNIKNWGLLQRRDDKNYKEKIEKCIGVKERKRIASKCFRITECSPFNFFVENQW